MVREDVEFRGSKGILLNGLRTYVCASHNDFVIHIKRYYSRQLADFVEHGMSTTTLKDTPF